MCFSLGQSSQLLVITHQFILITIPAMTTEHTEATEKHNWLILRELCELRELRGKD